MYCSECGAKNEKDALFCEECGAKLEQPKEEKTPKKKTQKKKNTKKLNKKQWIIIGIIIAVVVILFVVFQVLKTQTSPSKIVENYIEAINNKDYEKLYDYANYTGDQTFISKKAYTEAVKEKLEGKSTINNFVVGTTTYENGGLTAVVTVNATMRVGTSTTTTTDSSFEIKLTKEKEKAFLFFPKWTMADDELLGMNTTENYNITVPKDTEITYAGVKVTDKYLDKEEKEDYTETYILPQVLTTSTNVEFELPGGLEIEKEITPSSYSKRYSLSITTSDLTDKTKEKLTKEKIVQLKETLKSEYCTIRYQYIKPCTNPIRGGNKSLIDLEKLEERKVDGTRMWLLQPIDRTKNIYGINMCVNKPLNSFVIESVRKGFDVSDINRGDITPHEVISFNYPIEMGWQNEWWKYIKLDFVSREQFENDKLIRINKLKKFGLEPQMEIFDKEYKPLDYSLVNNLIYYVNLIDEFWDKSDEYTISISMNNNGKLVFWDIQTPVGKSKILRRTI